MGNVSGSSLRRFATIAAVADTMGVSVSSIRRRISDGSMPVVRLGRRVLIPLDHFDSRGLEGDSGHTGGGE